MKTNIPLSLHRWPWISLNPCRVCASDVSKRDSVLSMIETYDVNKEKETNINKYTHTHTQKHQRSK